MTFLHYLSLHLEEPNPSGRLPLDREWSWLLLQLRKAESEAWMLLESWSRAMYRGFYRFVPWATNYRDIHRVIRTLRDIFFLPWKTCSFKLLFFNIPAQICGRRKIIILLCIIQKSFPIFLGCLCFYIFSGVRNLSLISDERLYLCKTGDEIRSLNDRCDQKADCRDKSDERDCVQCKCKWQWLRPGN